MDVKFFIEEAAYARPDLLECIEALEQLGWFNARFNFHKEDWVIEAIVNGSIIGFLRFVIQEVGADSDLPIKAYNGRPLDESKILAYGVLPKHRNRGIGRQLMATLTTWCAERGIFQIRAHSSGDKKAAHRVFMLSGFGIHPIERGADREGAYFVKPLGLG